MGEGEKVAPPLNTVSYLFLSRLHIHFFRCSNILRY
uniref:Uncharacterized protein n=1 Tax=Anguilla anguilla TaxID=7936 RepID=A0A0E9RBV5_ANGAN